MSLQRDEKMPVPWVPGPDSRMQPQWPVGDSITIFEGIARDLIKPASPQVSIRLRLSNRDLLGRTYIVSCNGEDQFLLRILLPVDPVFKTWSEVATMAWAAQTLTPALDSDSDSDSRVIPVPTVLRNPVCRKFMSQYESILMTKPAGRPLAQAWWTLNQPAKERIVCQLARIYAAAFRNPLRGIGNLHPNCGVTTSLLRPYNVGRISSLEFFWHRHALYDFIDFGPFERSRDWLRARLELWTQDCIVDIRGGADDRKTKGVKGKDKWGSDSIQQDAKRALDLCYRLMRLVDRFFPPEDADTDSDQDATIIYPQEHHHYKNGNGDGIRAGDSREVASLEVHQPPLPRRSLSSSLAEPTVITHGGLTPSAIFVDAQNNISGIVDWDCATALPLWEACQLPLFLLVPSTTPTTRPANPPNPRSFKRDAHGYPVAAYWARLDEHQRARLADVFLAEMRATCPEWARLCADDAPSRARRDLSRAIWLVTDRAARPAVERWVGAAEREDEEEMQRWSLTGMGTGVEGRE
ncbi:hypothetical protein F4775DRAFT_498468 [Biscogniauxia sp. FL1348]|nr:hypothetical protein F4775DRAFT_498468 [Biscogniauxia sp. FL1348]